MCWGSDNCGLASDVPPQPDDIQKKHSVYAAKGIAAQVMRTLLSIEGSHLVLLLCQFRLEALFRTSYALQVVENRVATAVKLCLLQSMHVSIPPILQQWPETLHGPPETLLHCEPLCTGSDACCSPAYGNQCHHLKMQKYW